MEKEEEEQRKIQKVLIVFFIFLAAGTCPILVFLPRKARDYFFLSQEELRKVARKNRDEFRRLMEEHVASGMLTAKTHWRDYSLKVSFFVVPYSSIKK